jgi:hypothetical protein
MTSRDFPPRAPINAPAGAPGDALLSVKRGAALQPISDAPRVTSERTRSNKPDIPLDLDGLALGDLVLLPLYFFTDEDMRVAVARAAGACEKPDPVLRIRSSATEIQPIAAVHAYLLIQWWKARAWRGKVASRDLERIYQVFCKQRNLAPQPWQKVAIYLNYFTGKKRRMCARIGGKNLSIYCMPGRRV